MAELARLYDTWPGYKKKDFNPDGSLKEEARQRLIKNGFSLDATYRLEDKAMREVQAYERTEQIYLERHGVGFKEYCRQSVEKTRKFQRSLAERQRDALRSGEEQSSLPDFVEPDDYWDYYSSDDDD
ncbi:MAG: hypothetical protein ACFBSE_12905 [Prochloraceae cyanobacterium]